MKSLTLDSGSLSVNSHYQKAPPESGKLSSPLW